MLHKSALHNACMGVHCAMHRLETLLNSSNYTLSCWVATLLLVIPCYCRSGLVTCVYVHSMYVAGGSYRNWKRRHFVLKENTLSYYVNEGDVIPKGKIDLSTGRGVRIRQHCQLEWPSEAKPGLSFGLATESRTFYLYGNDKAAIR